MADFSYTPEFQHTDWVDNVDRVEAGGPNGFNKRFRDIQDDLHGVSTVVDEIGAELDKIAPPEVTLSIAPAFHPFADSQPWVADVGTGTPSITGVAKQLTSATRGVVPLNLPNGVRLSTLKVRGKGPATTAVVEISLKRILLATGISENVDTFSIPQVPFHTVRALPNADRNTVDLQTFSYMLVAMTIGLVASDPITLFGFQLTYVNP